MTGEPASERSPAAEGVDRLGLLATGSYLLRTAHQVFWLQGEPLWSVWPVLLALVSYASAFALLVLGLAAARPARWQRLVLAVVLLSVAGEYAMRLAARTPGEAPTDSAAFASYSAHLVLLGENPYAWDLTDAYDAYRISNYFMTPSLDGSPVAVHCYPALHFLLLVPFKAIGIEDLRFAYVIAHLALLVILFARAPPSLRSIVLLPLLVNNEYTGFTMSYLTDVVWVAFLAGVVAAWRQPFWRAVLYGLACAYKQTPWIVAPFLVVRLLLEGRDAAGRPAVRSAAYFFGVAGAVFLAINAPFVLLDPKAWLEAVLDPLTGRLIYFGSGLSALTWLGFTGLTKGFYASLSVVVLVLLLAIYALGFRRLRHALWLAPGVLLWFSYRGLHSYYVYWVPLLVAAASELLTEESASAAGAAPPARVPEPGAGSWPARLGRALELGGARRSVKLALVAAAGVLVLVAALIDCSRSRPIELELVSRELMEPGPEVGRLELLIHNTSERLLTPRISIQSAAWEPYPWTIESGPLSLPAGRGGHYRLATDLRYKALSLHKGGQIVVTDAGGDYGLRGSLKVERDWSLFELDGVFNQDYLVVHDQGELPWGWRMRQVGAQPAHVAHLETAEARGAVELGFVAQAGSDAWESVTLWQTIVFPAEDLAAWVRPPARAARGSEADEAYGLELVDGSRRLWVLFGAAAPGRRTLAEGHEVVTRPAPAGVWSEQRLSLPALWAEVGWREPPLARVVRGDAELVSRTVDIGLLVAARGQPGSTLVKGEFGPIRLLRDERAVRRRIESRAADQREYYLALSELEKARRNYPAAREHEATALSRPGSGRRVEPAASP